MRHRIVTNLVAQISGQDLLAEVRQAFRIMNEAKPWNSTLSVSPLVAPLLPLTASAASSGNSSASGE